jgi:hypothetical protein
MNLLVSFLQNNDDDRDGFDSRRIYIAALLVEVGVDYCVNEYKSRVEENQILNEPVVGQLTRSKEICKEIAAKLDLMKRERETTKNGLEYLFQLEQDSRLRRQEAYAVHKKGIWRI